MIWFSMWEMFMEEISKWMMKIHKLLLIGQDIKISTPLTTTNNILLRKMWLRGWKSYKGTYYLIYLKDLSGKKSYDPPHDDKKNCISWNISLKKKIIFILIIYSFILIKSYKNRTRKFEKLAFYFQDEWSSFLRENSSFTQRIVEYFGWFMRIVNMRKTFAVILPNVLIISFEMESN